MRSAGFFVAAFALAGFAISFMGFRQLVAVMYPIIGYLGMLMPGLCWLWLATAKAKIRKEGNSKSSLVYR